MRGFYGIVHVDKAGGEIVLTEARSGEEQVRWKMSSINRVFCPKTVCKRDKQKILVIITNRYVLITFPIYGRGSVITRTEFELLHNEDQMRQTVIEYFAAHCQNNIQ